MNLFMKISLSFLNLFNNLKNFIHLGGNKENGVAKEWVLNILKFIKEIKMTTINFDKCKNQTFEDKNQI